MGDRDLYWAMGFLWGTWGTWGTWGGEIGICIKRWDCIGICIFQIGLIRGTWGTWSTWGREMGDRDLYWAMGFLWGTWGTWGEEIGICIKRWDCSWNPGVPGVPEGR